MATALTVTRRKACAVLGASACAATIGLTTWSAVCGEQDRIKIGMIAPLTGASAEGGHFQVNGARLALDEVNDGGGALGRRVELITEDSQTVNSGAVLAFSRLVSRGDIAAYISGTPSTATHALAPDALKAGRPVIMAFATDPKLTHMGHPWLFRCRPSDVYSARVIAAFGSIDLGKRKWAIVYSTDVFGTAGMKALSETLGKTGLEPALIQGYANEQSDFMPVALAVKRADADVLATFFTRDNDLALFARQLREIGVNLPWIGSATLANVTTTRLAGSALYGTYTVADFAADASADTLAFAQRYEQTYKAHPDYFAAAGFDSVKLLARAINDANNTEPDALRRAILALRGFQGAEGEYNFDANGDGRHGYNVVRNDAGKIVFIRHVEFQD